MIMIIVTGRENCKIGKRKEFKGNKVLFFTFVPAGLIIHYYSFKFVFLPECCDFVGTNPTETLQLSESLDGDTIEFYKSLAKDHSLWLSIGGFHEIVPNCDKIQNTHVLINDDGKLIAAYRKLHLFDVDTPEFKFRESKVVQGGQHIVEPVITPIGRIGLLIVSYMYSKLIIIDLDCNSLSSVL